MQRCKINLEDERSEFRLVQALSWSNSPTSSIYCIMLENGIAPHRLWAATL
jgi:hypothetical protein